MDTEELISLLAADRTPPRRPRLGPRVLGAAALSILLLLALWGLRPGWSDLSDQPVMLGKVVWPLAIAALAALPLLRAPQDARLPLWPVAILAAALSGLWIYTRLSGGEIITHTTLRCLLSVPALALPVGAALFSGLLHRVVPSPARAGLAAGLAAGGIGAAIYALHCDEDAASFFLLWYGLGIALCGLAGRIAGPRLLGV